jgi:hypothetical protein
MKMTDLTFKDPEEAAAWDRYVAAMMGSRYASAREVVTRNADAMILERRKRMAPPAQIVYSEQFS